MREQLKPSLTRPRDFERFWDKTREALRQLDPAVMRQEHPESNEPHRSLVQLSFKSLENRWIRGYAISWTDEQPRPLVIHSHGYGSECALQWAWARAGLNVLGVDIRGFGRSFEAHPLRSKWGYILSGIDTPETSILRGAVCDYIRAVETGLTLFGGHTTRTVLHGFSFSGGLALMAEALIGAADLLVVGVPTFGWAEGRNFFVKSGSGAEISRFLDQRPESAEDTMLVLRYFDPMNFADMVKGPTLVGVGLADDVVPAKTVYAIANHLRGPREIMAFPVSHSNLPEEVRWEEFEQRWIRLALEGVPPDFGEEEVKRGPA